MPDPAGRPQRRLVDLGDVAKVLARHADHAVRWFQAASGVVAVGLSPDGSQKWLVVRPASKATIRIEAGGKKQTLSVALPSLLAELEGKSDQRGQAWLGIGRVTSFEGQLTPRTMLRACPLPNCYGDGRVCMGGIDERLFKGLEPLAFLERAFIGTTFTDHVIGEPLSPAGSAKHANIIQALRATKGRVAAKLLKEVGEYGKIYG